MAKEFQRSKQTNALFEQLENKHGIAVILEIPEVGKVHLDGENLREFLWHIRSNKSTELIEDWIDSLKRTIIAYTAGRRGKKPSFASTDSREDSMRGSV